LEAARGVLNDPEMAGRYPEGLTAIEVLEEIRRKEPGAFPLCTWLDVHDVLAEFYG
jgi:hypothetical protein